MNGTVLRSASINFWSSSLVLMKGIVCAYLSYALAFSLLDSKMTGFSRYTDFSFFYGSIPAGGAPLIIAAEVDPEVAPLVASASLLCLILAGPVEIVTASFLHNTADTSTSGVDYEVVHSVQFGVAIAS